MKTILALLCFSFLSFLERLCYYGSRATLVLLYVSADKGYTSDQLFNRVEQYSTALIALAIPFGLIIDQFIKVKNAISLGAICILLSFLLFAIGEEAYLWPAVILLLIGTSFSRDSLLAEYGSLFNKSDPSRGAGYAFHYSAVNLGAFTGIIAISWLAENYSYRIGLVTTASLMLLYFSIYSVIKNRVNRKEHTGSTSISSLTSKPIKWAFVLLGITILSSFSSFFGDTFSTMVDLNHPSNGALEPMLFEKKHVLLWSFLAMIGANFILGFLWLKRWKWKETFVIAGCTFSLIVLAFTLLFLRSRSQVIGMEIIGSLSILSLIGLNFIISAYLALITRITSSKWSVTVIAVYSTLLYLFILGIESFSSIINTPNLLPITIAGLCLTLLIILVFQKQINAGLPAD